MKDSKDKIDWICYDPPIDRNNLLPELEDSEAKALFERLFADVLDSDGNVIGGRCQF